MNIPFPWEKLLGRPCLFACYLNYPNYLNEDRPFSFKSAGVFLNVSFIINTEVETKNSQSKFSPKTHTIWQLLYIGPPKKFTSLWNHILVKPATVSYLSAPEFSRGALSTMSSVRHLLAILTHNYSQWNLSKNWSTLQAHLTSTGLCLSVLKKVFSPFLWIMWPVNNRQTESTVEENW